MSSTKDQPSDDLSRLQDFSRVTESLLGSPFEWCFVQGGTVTIEDASDRGGTSGGIIQVADFALAKYPITNAQYQRFLDDPSGYSSPSWWEYSSAAVQWRQDHPSAKPTAFSGAALPRTRVSWFDALAFCAWLSSSLAHHLCSAGEKCMDTQEIATWYVRLPTEEQWQRAAIGEGKGQYPWGNHLGEKHCNYGNVVGQPTHV
jgi:formylglycine-generating enzyme required for sulfatase activity